MDDFIRPIANRRPRRPERRGPSLATKHFNGRELGTVDAMQKLDVELAVRDGDLARELLRRREARLDSLEDDVSLEIDIEAALPGLAEPDFGDVEHDAVPARRQRDAIARQRRGLLQEVPLRLIQEVVIGARDLDPGWGGIALDLV